MSQQMDNLIEGGIREMEALFDFMDSLSPIEYALHIATLKCKLNEINEHGLGDSDTEATKWFIKRDLDLFTDNIEENGQLY